MLNIYSSSKVPDFLLPPGQLKGFTEMAKRQVKLISSCSPALGLLFATGIIVALGGIFLALAAHQILPCGPNMISELSLNGALLGYATIAAGALITGVALYRAHCAQNRAIADKKYELIKPAIQERAKKLSENQVFAVVVENTSPKAIHLFGKDSVRHVSYVDPHTTLQNYSELDYINLHSFIALEKVQP